MKTMRKNYIVVFLFAAISTAISIFGLPAGNQSGWHGSLYADDVVVGLPSSNGDDSFRVDNSAGLTLMDVFSNGTLEMASNLRTVATLSTYSDAVGNLSELNLRKARGTIAIPTAIQAGNLIGSIFAEGYDGTGWADNGPGIDFGATQNWTNTAQGSYIQ